MKENYIEVESNFKKAFEPNFCVAPSLSEPTTYFIFREVGHKLWKEIRVRVLGKELIHNVKLNEDEIKYFNKHIV